MRTRIAYGGILVALSLVISVFGAAGAAPARAAPATVFVNPHIVQKVILPQTSIDGLALWTSPSGDIQGASPIREPTPRIISTSSSSWASDSSAGASAQP